ncbi:MAG: hypothetical protein AAGJ83_10365 [Planctomycetota bacterium]
MKKWAIGCSVFVVLGFVLIAAFGIWLLRVLPVLEASVSAPVVVQQGDEFVMTVTAANSDRQPIVLDSIDISDEFLAGFRLVEVQPEPIDTMSIFGMQSWEFGESVAAGDSIDITFTFQAMQPGQYVGDVDVCNPNQDFTTAIADVLVEVGTAEE